MSLQLEFRCDADNCEVTAHIGFTENEVDAGDFPGINTKFWVDTGWRSGPKGWKFLGRDKVRCPLHNQ